MNILPPSKKIRLDHPPLPVSSGEELNLVILKEQNKRLRSNHTHRLRIEADLKTRIQQLEETLKLCENKETHEQLSIVNEDLRNRCDQLESELNKSRLNERRLEEYINDIKDTLSNATRLSATHQANVVDSIRNSSAVNCHTDLNKINQNSSSINAGGSSGDKCSSNVCLQSSQNENNDGLVLNSTKYDELHNELDDQRDLAAKRLSELEKLNESHAEALVLIEKLKLEARCIPASVIFDSAEYKTLQSHFSVLYNEATVLRTQLEEAKTQILDMKNSHLKQIELMETEEMSIQKKLRTELVQLEDNLSQLKREYDMLRLEFESALQANDQLGPMNNEFKQQNGFLKTLNEQLKGEIQRFKRKYAETRAALEKANRQIESLSQSNGTSKPHLPPPSNNSHQPSANSGNPSASADNSLSNSSTSSHSATVFTSKPLKTEIKLEHASTNNNHAAKHDIKTESVESHVKTEPQSPIHGQNHQISTVVPTKNSGSTTNSNASHVSNHSSSLSVNHSSSSHASNHSNNSNQSSSTRKINELKEMVHNLQKQLAATKQEEDALMHEMDVTGQAFEEQEVKYGILVQQLEEKEAAHFKLMSERLKANAIQKLLNDEKLSLTEMNHTLASRVEALENIVKSLGEKERLLQENLATLEKELALRESISVQQRQVTAESQQSLSELRLDRDKYSKQLDEIQTNLSDKTSQLQHELFKTRRLTEDLESWRRKYERAKKFESASSADEVLIEEIRGYKEQLTCPSCKTAPKDAVLTKCFHVFCFDCIKTRVETRQRKCPKCNAQFGVNDYHKLYLA